MDYYTVRRIEAIARGVIQSPNLEKNQLEQQMKNIIESCDVLMKEDRT